MKNTNIAIDVTNIATDTNNQILEGIVSDRLPTWDGVGRSVNTKSMVDTLQQAGLDYDVALKPITLQDGTPIADRFATVRSDGHVYDVVSSKYNIVQNRDAFEFVNYMSDEIEFLKAGETASGVVWVIARMEDVSILGDTFTPHVIFRNGFNGKVKISAAICPLRIICQNQFNMAFRNAANTAHIRHVMNVQERILEARETLLMSAEYMRSLKTMAEKMAVKRLNNSQVDRVIARMFPLPEGRALEKVNPFAMKTLLDRRASFVAAYEHVDNTNFRGTAWGMVNAYTDFMTHTVPSGKTESRFENRFMKSVFAPNFTGDIMEILDAA